MGDDWFGHRDPFTGEPEGDRDEWIDWDWLLSRALQTVEDWTNDHGLLRYEVDDHLRRVDVDAVKKIDRFEEAKARRTSGKNYKPADGEYFIPRLSKRSKEWPTLEEHIQYLVDQEKDDDVPDFKHPDDPSEKRIVQN